MPAKKGDVVVVHYTGTLTDDTQFDTSRGREPMTFTIGEGAVIPGFENAIIGLEPGENITVTIEPAEAYGFRLEDAVHDAPVSMFGAEMAPAEGTVVTLVSPDGTQFPATVGAPSEDGTTVLLDLNHPLADETLNFDIELVEIIEPAVQ